jgi:SAM-dependent methyltransferase
MPLDASEFFFNLALGYRSAQVVNAANALGLFEALEGRTVSAEVIASELHCDPRAMRTLLRALAQLELLVEEGACYANTEFASRHLVPGAPAYVGHNLKYQSFVGEGWSQLERIVRTGRPWRELRELLESADQPFTDAYIRGMVPIGARAAVALAEALGPDPIHSMADVGGGPGTYALALLDRHPELTATLLDLPCPLAVAREVTSTHSHRDRLCFLPGDYLQVDYGSDHDLVLLSHVTHDEPPESVATLLRKAHTALRPGGRVAIHDWVHGDDAAHPLWSAFFAVHVMTYTGGGRVYTLSQYEALLREAGFVDAKSVQILAGVVPNPTCLLVAKKPV